MSTYLEFGAPVQASCQQLASLDGYRCQLPLVFQNVSNGVDMGHIGLLFIVHWNFSIPGEWHGKISEDNQTILYLNFMPFCQVKLHLFLPY